MDDRRFDTLARAIAGSGSRRGLLRGFAAGAIALLSLDRRAPRVAAQSGYLGPGEACYDDRQCGNTRYSPMFCADNGYAYDGPLNCCADEFGYCYSDEGCCGLASCISGSCISAPSGPLDPGDPCQNDTQCVASGTTCEYVGQTGDSRCCGDEGSRCGGDAECCGWLVCPPGDFSGAFCATACTSTGCPCIAGTTGACDDGLLCCAQGDPGVPGLCLTSDACSVSMASFNGEGEQCAIAAPNACAEGLFCCGSGDVGTCLTAANC